MRTWLNDHQLYQNNIRDSTCTKEDVHENESFFFRDTQVGWVDDWLGHVNLLLNGMMINRPDCMKAVKIEPFPCSAIIGHPPTSLVITPFYTA